MGAAGSRGDGEQGEDGDEPTVLQLSSGMRILLSEGNVRINTVASFCQLVTLSSSIVDQ